MQYSRLFYMFGSAPAALHALSHFEIDSIILTSVMKRLETKYLTKVRDTARVRQGFKLKSQLPCQSY